MKYCAYCIAVRGLSPLLKCINGNNDKQDIFDTVDQQVKGDISGKMIYHYLCPDCGSIFYGVKG